MVEPPLALLEEEVEMGFRNAVVAREVPLRLVQEVLDAVDMVPLECENLRMIDPVVMKFRDVEIIIRAEAVGVDDAVRLDALADNPDQCQ